MKSKFKVGDIVEAWGVRGKVLEVDSREDVTFPVRVEFDEGNSLWFTRTGKIFFWAKKRSLKLIERPKAKIKKKVYVGVDNRLNLSTDTHYSTLAYPTKEELEEFIGNNTDIYKIVEVEIEVDE